MFSLFRVPLATCTLATLAATAVLPAAPAAAIHWTNVAWVGQTVSGLPNGEVLGSVSPGILNVRPGRVVFEGKWGSSARNEALFAWTDAGGFVPAVAPGMPVPGIEAGWIFSGGASNYNRVYGAPNAAKSSPGEPASNTNGDIAFYSWIRRAASFCDSNLMTPYVMTPYARCSSGPMAPGPIRSPRSTGIRRQALATARHR